MSFVKLHLTSHLTTAKFISLAGLLLLSGTAFASTAPAETAQPTLNHQIQNAASQHADRVNTSTPQPPQASVELLAWQRVGAPLSLEG